jgi:hypothetical protein
MCDMSLSLPISLVRRVLVALALSACLIGLAWAKAQPAAAGGQTLDLRVSVAQAPGSGATLKYRGTFTGTPLGSGKVSLVTRLSGNAGARVTYVMTTSRGSFSGSGDVTLTYHGSTVDYRGKASITKGTGAYRHLRSNSLTISGQAGLTSDRTTLRLSGPISF